jgi:hypothetical protein
MLDSTRFAITMRDVAGPQVSPVGQSLSFEHLVSPVRHMPVPLVVVILQLSPVLPARHEFVAPGVQVLATPTQALVSMQGLLACDTVQG